MKLKDFLTLKVGAGVLISGTRYNPYINYSWSQTLTVGGNQQIKDTGTAGLNLKQFFGQGVWFNGVDQNITIPVNTTIQTEIKRVNGITTINTNTQSLTNYNVYSGTGTKTIKDLYMFNRVLTQTEIEKYNNQPNQFFMDSLEDSSCILAMPMCEKDGFVRNYKSYSYSSFLINNIGLKSCTHSGTRIAQLNAGLLVKAGKTYLIKYSFIDNVNIKNFKGYIPPSSNGGTAMNLEFTRTNTNNEFIVTIPTTYTGNDGESFYCWLAVNGTSISVNFDEASIREISGIYPITNYLTTCRTNAQRLPYGLQTSGFKRDTNGLILSKSNFLEAEGVGYGNTGWVPKWNEDFTVESVFEVSNDSEFRLNGNNYADGIYFGKNSVGKSLYVRVFGSNVILLANSKDIVCLIFSYNWQTKEVKQYVDGVLVTTQLATKTTNSPLPVLLGMVVLGGTNYPVIKPLRLFKTHSKVLTQEEVSKNFNKYQAQGLLSESGLLFPDNALVDENGNFILDENNNFIIVE